MDVEKVREAALAHYEGLTEDQKQAAREFFEAMDTDKSGNISIDEFMDFLSHAGFQSDNHNWLFEELDKDDNGTLDFKELLTFFYIISCDKYKDLLNSRPKAAEPPRKRRFRGRTRGVNDRGQRRNWGEFFERYSKLRDAFNFGRDMGRKLSDILTDNGCSIV